MTSLMLCYVAVSRNTACKCFTVSISAFTYLRFFAKVLIETNVNISNQLNFSDGYHSVNYTGSIAKLTCGLIYFVCNTM